MNDALNTIRPTPYLGPRSFQTGEKLYGRDYEARSLLSLLIAERIVLLHSPSGAGKTSLVQAALVPMLEERDFTVWPIIRVGQTLPAGITGNRYIRSTLLSLEEGQLPGDQLSPAALATMTLRDYVAQRIPADEDPILIFDQFEEVLTLDPTDTAAKQAFFADLGVALEDRRIRVLFVMREEFVAAMEPFARPIPTRLEIHFRLDLLGVDGALAALREPPRSVGVEFPEELASGLIDDLRRVNVQQADGTIEQQLGPSVEPVQLQVVGLRLWDRLPPDANSFTAAVVQGIGDVGQVLGDYYADRVTSISASNGTSERALRSWFERELITPQGVRGQVLQGEGISAGLDNQAIRQLIDAYLVRAEPRRGATWYELSHDRLIAPVQRSNAAWFAANLSTLQRQAELWERQGRPAGLLLRGETLREAEAWAQANPDTLTESERDFLKLCQIARQQAARLRNLAIGATVLSIVALIGLGTALWFFNRAEQERRQAVARELAAAADGNLAVDPLRSLLLAQAAVETTARMQEPTASEALEALYQSAYTSRVRQIVQVSERGLQHLAASPDGNIIATTGNDGLLRFFGPGLNELRTIPTNDDGLPAFGLSFSPDGRRVAASVGTEVIIWDVGGGQELQRFSSHSDTVLDVAFSPDGASLAGAGRDGKVFIWDAQNGAERLVIALEDTEINTIDYSPDGSLIAAGADDATVYVWDATTGEEVFLLEGHLYGINEVAFSPEGDYLASASVDLSVRLWDVEDGAPLDVLRGHASSVETVDWSADGRMLATTSQDGTARLWALSDGRQIVSLAGHNNGLSGAIFSPDNATLTTASLDGSLRRWDLSFAPEDGAYQVAYSSGGTTLATAGTAGVHLWEARTGKLMLSIPSDVEISAIAYAPNGNRLAMADTDGLIQIVDTESGEALATMEGHEGLVSRLAWSPDGTTVASASFDGSARLWNAEEGSEQLVFGEHTVEVSAISFSPDGTLVASSDQDGTIKIWEVASGNERLSLTLTFGEVIFGLDWSPDGAYLAAADEGGELALWQTSDGKELMRRGVGEGVTDLAYSPDGTTIVIGGRDRVARLWDAATLQPRQDLPHPSEVSSLSLSPDGLFLATGSIDGQARIFPLDQRTLFEAAKQQAIRQPTPDECSVFRLQCATP
jgi:WD40 repeat protein